MRLYLIIVAVVVVHLDTWIPIHLPSLSLVLAPLSTFQSSGYVPKPRSLLSKVALVRVYVCVNVMSTYSNLQLEMNQLSFNMLVCIRGFINRFLS